MLLLFSNHSFARPFSCDVKNYRSGTILDSSGIPVAQEDPCKLLDIDYQNILIPFIFSSRINDSKEKKSFKIEHFYSAKISTYEILDKYKLSMKFSELIKNCTHRENIGKYKSIQLEAFDCNAYNLPSGSSISLITYHYPQLSTLQLASIILKTCSPTWTLMKQALVDKYSNSSKSIEDFKDSTSGTNKITFRVSKFSPERVTGQQKERKDCSSGLGLQLSLVNEGDLIGYFEEISKIKLENQANQTPIPKF